MRTFGWSLCCAIGLTLLVGGTVMGLDRRVSAWASEAALAGEPVTDAKKAPAVLPIVPSEKPLLLVVSPIDPKVHAPNLPEPSLPEPSRPEPVDVPDIFHTDLEDEDDAEDVFGGIVSGY
jgi:hypothetical protein